ncbi:MAG TPA: hypothetical protein VG963_07395 [Polyangiaceae bacterium]|nr:hypothetical protein [Polyangiaceae bacterium]
MQSSSDSVSRNVGAPFRLGSALVACALFAACSGNSAPSVGDDESDDSSSADPSESAQAVTYHRDVRPWIESRCLGCHVQGGIGPVPLDDWDSVEAVQDAIVSAVTSRAMPPSPWNRDCRDIRDDPALPQDALDTFTAWRDGGYLEGRLADYVAPAPRAKQDLGAPSIMMSSGVGYTPPANADEYRCFVLDTLPRDTYLTALQILPEQASEVHHVQIHRVSADQYQTVRAKDQSDPKPGYVCFGGTGVDSQNMFSYRPGSEAVFFDPGDAAYIEGGSGLIIQVHYNTAFLPKGETPKPDETKIALWTLPDGELPERIVYRTTVFGPVNLPPGNPHVVSTITTPMSQLSTFGGGLFGGTFVPGDIVGMTPHAHQLAARMDASLQQPGGSTTCLDDVPHWDFNWQLDYLFKVGVPYGPDDQLTGNCEYDNSADNQPVINGVKQQPRYVTFGERSIDEMCQHYIWLRFNRDDFLSARGGS